MAAFVGAGIAVPVSAVIQKSLAGPVADYALALALRARYPSGAPGVEPLIEQAESRWDTTIKTMKKGGHPAIAAALSVAASSGGGMSALNYWDDKAPATHLPDALDGTPLNPNLEPTIYKGMHL